jgi:hypothetical protein
MKGKIVKIRTTNLIIIYIIFIKVVPLYPILTIQLDVPLIFRIKGSSNLIQSHNCSSEIVY